MNGSFDEYSEKMNQCGIDSFEISFIKCSTISVNNFTVSYTINLHIPQTQNRSQFLVTTVYNTTLTAEDTNQKYWKKALTSAYSKQVLSSQYVPIMNLKILSLSDFFWMSDFEGFGTPPGTMAGRPAGLLNGSKVIFSL